MPSPARGARRLTLLALLIAAAAVTSGLERLLPTPLPMVKPGLANLWTLAAFALLGPLGGVVVTGGRVAVTALLFGGILSPSSALSFAGAAASLAAMVPLVQARGRFSLWGVSAAGAVAHVAGQLAAASLLLGTAEVWRLLPYLGLLGLATGAFNAWAAIRLGTFLLYYR